MAYHFDHPALYPSNLPDAAEAATDAYMSLKPTEKAFVDAYLATMGESAKAAGVALVDQIRKANAHDIAIPLSGRAQAMLANPRVQIAIHQRAREICARFEIDQNALIREVANIGFSNMANYVHIDSDGIPYIDFSNVTYSQMSAISEIVVEDLEPSPAEKAVATMTGEDPKPRRKVKLKLHSKLDAIEKLMKYLQMYAPERVEHHHTIQAAIVTANMTPDQLAQMYSDKLKGNGQ